MKISIILSSLNSLIYTYKNSIVYYKITHDHGEEKVNYKLQFNLPIIWDKILFYLNKYKILFAFAFEKFKILFICAQFYRYLTFMFISYNNIEYDGLWNNVAENNEIK